MIWQKKLTKAELKHIRSYGVRTLKGMKELALSHSKYRKQESRRKLKKAGVIVLPMRPYIEPCFTCKSIARKLGFPT
jgi:hypothetical protein